MKKHIIQLFALIGLITLCWPIGGFKPFESRSYEFLRVRLVVLYLIGAVVATYAQGPTIGVLQPVSFRSLCIIFGAFLLVVALIGLILINKDRPRSHTPNQSVETNRRIALPFDASWEFIHAVHAPPFLSAGIAYLWRWTNESLRRLMKISRRQFGWAVASLGLTIAAILWYLGSGNSSPMTVGVRLSAVEHTVAAMGPISCTVDITNASESRVVIQAELERPVNGQWQIIPCRQPGPMYVSALWVLDSGEVKTVTLPTPLDRGTDVSYRIRADYWVRERPLLEICYETLREKLRGVRDVGSALLRRNAPRPGFIINSSGYAVIGGRGGTPINWRARRSAYTEEWNSVQRTDAPNPAPAPWFEFEGIWGGVGDP